LSGGSVTILDQGNILGVAQRDDTGTATLQAALTAGSHVLRASFAGSAQLSTSVSPNCRKTGLLPGRLFPCA
jgi:Big-like domain-containing protein